MKNLSINIIGLMCFLMVSLSNCSLDPKMTDKYGPEVAWSSDKNLQLYLNKFYPLIGQTYYTGAVNADAQADILKMNAPTDNVNLLAFGSVIITPGNNMLGNWDWGYTWIKECNQFLQDMAQYGGTLPDSVKNRAAAEVKWFRGYVYFEMAKRYGATLIIRDKLTSDPNTKLNTPDEVWDYIEKELDASAEGLPAIVPATERGKLTKGAAYGLKARAMLYAKRWKKASDAVAAMDALHIYDLYPDYEALFNMRRSSPVANKESVLEFGFSSPNFGYSFDYFFCPPGDKGYAQVSPTEELAGAYQMADGTDFSWSNAAQAATPYEGREPRFYASILYNGASWKGRTVQTYEGGVDGFGFGGGTTCTGYYMKKLFDGSKKTQTDGFLPGELTFYFMRYAEVLLINAEAQAEQDHIDLALESLNKVRARAGFTTPVSAGSKDAFMKLLRHERMIELAFEGHRYWDLRRWDLAKTVLNNTHFTGVKITKSGETLNYELVDCDSKKTRVYPAKYNRLPIPSSEIERNPLCEQFPEWK
jgi:hypothetical protein